MEELNNPLGGVIHFLNLRVLLIILRLQLYGTDVHRSVPGRTATGMRDAVDVGVNGRQNSNDCKL